MTSRESGIHESSVNPYAAPVAAVTQAAAPTDGGIWRSGKQLIMHRAAVLPDTCVKSNEPTEGYRLKRKLRWHHPALFVALVSPLIYIILAAVLSKRATVEIGMSERWRGIRRRRIWTAAILVLAGIGLFFAGFFVEEMLPARSPVIPLMVLGGFLLGIIGLLYGVIASQIIKPAKIDDHYVYIHGVHPDFLDRYSAIDLPG